LPVRDALEQDRFVVVGGAVGEGADGFRGLVLPPGQEAVQAFGPELVQEPLDVGT
jgi:hypothetical protein